MSNFLKLKNAVSKQFAKMQQHQLFRTGVDKDALYATYLNSFPEGTNLLFRKRTKHDCSCCKQFIRAIGDVVAIIDGKLVSIWDVELDDATYSPVAAAMAELVKRHGITGKFLHYEKHAGTDKTFEQRIGEAPHRWDHFFVNIPAQFVKEKASIPSLVGAHRSSYDVLYRALRELKMDAIDTVLELIDQNSLYRGAEHRAAVAAFKALKQGFSSRVEEEQSLYIWSKVDVVGSLAHIRNTSIGTLLVDLSEGVDLEHAVKKFETMVAPANYKRPTALVTQAMINQAKETINVLGLGSALERRYAHASDIAVNNVLFKDNVAKRLNVDVFDDIAVSTKPKNFDRVEEIHIDKFISDVLPSAQQIEVLFEGKHKGNLFSLIAPSDPTAGKLFKWDNGFSWSYNGDMADSIKERVKQAGGNVTGDLCCRLAWFNYDDLDLHMAEASNYYEISFRNRSQRSPSGGMLDVDMNAGSGITREAVENIYYPTISKMRNGVYHLFVNQFCQREAKDVGFQVDIDLLGDVQTFTYDKPVKNGENITVARIVKEANGLVKIEGALPNSTRSQQVWGINTNQFHRVKLFTLSPNYWGERGVGNKHYFFVLDGCKNDGNARGFFNEFLSSDLDKHRKVFEIVGSKMKAQNDDEQLSGLGFSSTAKNQVVVKVTGNFTRMLRIVF